MATIHFKKGFSPIPAETNANLMQAIQAAGIPIGSTCGGEGICAKCKVTVIEGGSNLSPETEVEAFIKSRDSLPPATRISCKVQVLGDITIDTGYW